MPICSLYSNEKKDKEGDGCIIKYISVKDLENENIDDIKKRLRKKQKEENDKYLYFKNRMNKLNKVKEEEHVEIYPKLKSKDDIIKYIIPLEEIPIKEIDFINMDDNNDSGNSICLIGSSKAGKSTAMMGLFNKYFNNNKFISTLFSINSHIPIYKTSGDLIKVNKFINVSEQMIKDMKKINMNSEPPNKWRFCILLDDIVDARYSRVLNALLLTYRNANFSSLISIQYPKLLSKSARCSANNLLFFSQNLQEGIETVLRSFLGAEFAKRGITKFNEQISLYRELTKDHSFLYYHPMSQTLRRIRLKI
jgi:hypothetical protein